MLTLEIGPANRRNHIYGVLALRDECGCACRPKLMCHPRGLDVSWLSFSGLRQASADGLGHGEPQQHLESVLNGLSVIFSNSIFLVL
jgi:hypothetical protein